MVKDWGERFPNALLSPIRKPLPAGGNTRQLDYEKTVIFKIMEMDNEITSIHNFKFDLIRKYFAKVERQGPGSPETTVRALSFIENLSDIANIADIGCGTGGQTMVIAQQTAGNITGIDLSPDFINKLNQKSKSLNLQDRVNGIVGNMEELPFRDEEFDLIWSEGAIYKIGFQHGLNEWRKFLKTGGYLAVTEPSWFTDERPAKIQAFWQNVYREIDTIANKVTQMQKAGYIPVAVFILPENCWTENFYDPLIPVQEAFSKKYTGNKTVEEFIAGQRHESALYRKYKAFYGYTFYIGKKI